jgi:hypothetical protein
MSSILERSILIDLLLDHPNPIIDWFNSIWNNIQTLETNIFNKDGGEIIYYIITDFGEAEWIFYQNNDQYFWTSHTNYWHKLNSEFGLRAHFGAHTVTKILVVNVLGHNVAATADYANYAIAAKIEYALSHYINLNNEHHYE